MKKFALFLVMALTIPAIATAAKKSKMKTFNDVYIYAQSSRNTKIKGSATSLSTGITKGLEAASTDPKDIDVMLYYGKVDHSKTKFFTLFSPGNPTLDIDWEKEGGTSPYCKFEGKSDDPDAFYALKNWKKRNDTKLEKLDGIDFDAATAEQISGLTVADSYWAKDVKVGDVILFEMSQNSYEAGAKGLIKIVAIEDDPDPKRAEKKGQGQYQRINMSIKFVK
ncbi:MAG: hypothetical protein II766_03810 [Paludibacteraceae bacterium]|jgi:hypothetical protein|nr:hypothetical protein [Paludibacteraceae bacterium]